MITQMNKASVVFALALLINIVLLVKAAGTEEINTLSPITTADSTEFRNSSCGWQFDGHILNQVVAPFEPVWLETTLLNTSDEDKYAPLLGSLYPFMDYSIYTNSNEPVKITRTKVQRIMDSSSVPIIKAHTQKTNYTNILKVVAFRSQGRQMLPSGDYYLDVSLYYDPWSRQPRDVNTLSLPRLAFHVITTTGDTAQALAVYERGLSLIKVNAKDARQVFERIIKEYDHTPYGELANDQLNMLATDMEDAIFWRSRYFLHYPHSPMNIKNFNTLRNYVSDSQLKVLYRAIQGNTNATITLDYMKSEYPWVTEQEQE